MPAKGYDLAPANVRAAISEAARLEGVSEETLIAIIGRESTFKPTAANPKSSARGLGQHLDDTWNKITTRRGGKYGITPSTSRFDPRASALMTAALANENADYLKRNLGREPSSGEVYAAHFLGGRGARDMIRAAQANPTAAAATLFPAAAKSNPTIFYGPGKVPKSMKDVLAGLTATGGSGSTAPFVGGALPNIYGSEPLPPKPSFFERLKDGYKMAAEQEQTQVMATQFMLAAGDDALAPDPNFRWTPQLITETTGDLPEDKAEWVVQNAQSARQAQDLRRRAIQDMENEAELASYGLGANLGLRGAAVLTDIPTWVIGFGAGKLVGAAKVGKVALAGRAGLIAAAEQVPISAVKSQALPSYGLDDALLDTTSAFAFGGAFGAVLGKGGRDLDDFLAREAADVEREVLETSGHKLTPKGEAYYEQLAGQRRVPQPISAGAAAVPQPGAKNPILRGRFDVIGQLKSRGVWELDELADKLDIDAVGDGGKSLRGGETAYESMRRMNQSMDAKVERAVTDEFKAWASARGLTGHKSIQARRDFNEEVYRQSYAPSPDADPNVARAASAYDRGYQEFLAEAKAAGAKWAEDVTPNDHYVPMLFDRQKVREMIARFDEDGVASVISQAMRAANRELSQEIADKAAAKYLRTVTSVTEGTNAGKVHAISGQDRQGLRDLLVEQGMDEVEADAVVQVLKPQQKSGPSRFRKRTLLDDVAKFTPEGRKDGASFSVRELTMQDAEEVWQRYSRQMSGQIAMVRQGFQSQGAFETAARQATLELQNTRPGYSDSLAKTDFGHLQMLGRSIYGIPHRDMNTTAGRVESIFGSWNFARFMGQSGIAQLGDVPKVFLRTSVEAAWRQFRMADMARVFQRGGQEADALARDLETLTGVGTIGARNRITGRYLGIEEFYPEDGSRRALDQMVRLGKTTSNLVATVSGMNPITDFLGRWATRASVQHLADIARGAKAKPQNMLNDMGLGSSELARFKALVDLMDIAPNGVIRDLRLEKLQKADPQGTDLLGAWISRQARLAVLDPSPGMLPHWMTDSAFRFIGQFRTFSMASHAANTMRNIKMGPAYFAQSAIATGAWATMIYLGHTYAKSIGRPDQEEYLAKMMEPSTALASGFQRSADSGIIPMLFDTAMSPLYAATGMDPVFANGRTTGLEAGIMGIPAISAATDLLTAAQEGIADPFRAEKKMTQEDAKRLARLLPLNNTYLLANAVSAVTGELPKDEPYEPDFE